jgi:hypothetical protein
MTSLIDVDPARHLRAAEIVLVAEFPDVTPADIHVMMQRESHRFDAATTRDHVSTPVSRAVRSRLRTDPTHP